MEESVYDLFQSTILAFSPIPITGSPEESVYDLFQSIILAFAPIPITGSPKFYHSMNLFLEHKNPI
jgi:hypothetical protein